MNGQMTLFDVGIETDDRPCRYSFHRFVGQIVRHTRYGICRISNIDHPYYTELQTEKGHHIIMGTPYDVRPIEESEKTNGMD